MARPEKYDWTTITAEFVAGTMSVAAHAAHWGVPFATMRARYTKYKWKNKRAEYQAKLYREMLAQNIEQKKAAFASIQAQAQEVVGNVVTHLCGLAERSQPRGGLTPETAQELQELRDLVSSNYRMTKEQTTRLFELCEMEGRSHRAEGMEPGDVEKTLKSLGLALQLGERALGLEGVQNNVTVTLQYVPPYLRNLDQEGD